MGGVETYLFTSVRADALNAFRRTATPDMILGLFGEIDRLNRCWQQHVGPIEADRECLREDIAAMTEARDEACDIASSAISLAANSGRIWILGETRITQLRQVGVVK